MKRIKNREEFFKTISDYFLYEKNQKSAIKLQSKDSKLIWYLVKGLWPDYIDKIWWECNSVVRRIFERDGLFTFEEMQSVIQHPANSLGCIFILRPISVFPEIQPIEVPASIEFLPWFNEWKKDIDLSGIEIFNIGIGRYDFLQDIKEWRKGSGKILSISPE